MNQAISSSNLPTSPNPVSVNAELKSVFKTIFAFSPNRDTLGGTAYLLVSPSGNILIDCPPWNPMTQSLLQQHGGVRWFVFTHRGNMGSPSAVQQLQSHFQCDLLVQEQEAYLFPDLDVQTFQHTFQLSPTSEMIWTPGHTPGSACLYHQMQEADHSNQGVLFTGRHLLPNVQGEIQPLRVAKTFHWFRQLRSIQTLRDRFTAETLEFACPGANTGFLRKQRKISHFYQQLIDLDLESLKKASVGL